MLEVGQFFPRIFFSLSLEETAEMFIKDIGAIQHLPSGAKADLVVLPSTLRSLSR